VAGLPGADHRRRTARTDALPAHAGHGATAVLRHRRRHPRRRRARPADEDAGLALFSAGLLALAVWLLRYDIARRNARQQGLVRFIALCLLSGYAWLVLAGLLGLAGGFLPGHPWRDATLHAVGLGFVFSMIFGHAPIIFPAVVRVKIPYHPFFYLPLLVLHASLALRIFGGLGDALSAAQRGRPAQCHRPAAVHRHDDRQRGARRRAATRELHDGRHRRTRPRNVSASAATPARRRNGPPSACSRIRAGGRRRC
jgi:hypothetical protein